MPRPLPQIGDTNVRGFVLPDTCAGDVSALESIYGDQNPDVKNPLIFAVPGTGVDLPVGTEVVFDVIAGPQGEAVASNIRRA